MNWKSECLLIKETKFIIKKVSIVISNLKMHASIYLGKNVHLTQLLSENSAVNISYLLMRTAYLIPKPGKNKKRKIAENYPF